MVLTAGSVNETQKCNDSNRSYQAIFNCGTVRLVYSEVLTFESEKEAQLLPLNRKLLERIRLYLVVFLLLQCVNEILNHDLSDGGH